MSRKQYLYHVTEKGNVPKILKDGLTRKNGFAVYLSENPYSWWKPGLAILKVRITGLKNLYTFLPEIDEIFSFEDIPPQRIYRFQLPRKKAQLKSMDEVEGEQNG